jgi:hypothetical protein
VRTIFPRFRNPLSKSFSRKIARRKIVGLALALCLFETLPAQADYQPPSEPSAPTAGTSTAGTRGGCSGNADGGLTALAPLSYTGQTASNHPTFLWFVADTQSYPLEFRLYQHTNGKRRLLQKVTMQSHPGLMQFSLPTHQPDLAPGQTYSWQVILSCNPNHPSGDSVAGATLQVVPLSSSLRSQLTTAKSAIERANVYAQNGLWYDAIAQVAQPNQAIPAQRLQLSLLNNLARSEKETPEFAAIVHEQKVRLKQIAVLQQKRS